ncbi:hypothetical protein M404DRAFT_993492, partial [Pisolithus tinctorius Marx 270]
MGPKTEGPNEYLKVIVASFGWILRVWCSASEQSYYCGAVRLRPGLVDKSHRNYAVLGLGTQWLDRNGAHYTVAFLRLRWRKRPMTNEWGYGSFSLQRSIGALRYRYMWSRKYYVATSDLVACLSPHGGSTRPTTSYHNT